jgi:hypothetical protein
MDKSRVIYLSAPLCNCGKKAIEIDTKCSHINCGLCHQFNFCGTCLTINKTNKLAKQKS